ncbi:4-deoxy-L-threo-5-hexosulose-uronate ketol-isomerase [Aliiruegeria haliotis]|uniref:4-deoxy-L-threo-5-hexosulose-uronate ketol-isomerase n=1 Tax=Aliiruegeria haliotis TaxID=1280846 RepID=A0A2T0RTD2_9RHOB|nr:5-dehydro-4-deoxy-D-glucuronate isomerase [Aliiruegeria haliotis]PRY24446.1 4-deoxy-L-threo-5-hexosulose-uronate ketol-isomerase [Aliiruegeria haliotis]
MLTVTSRYAIDPETAKAMDTDALRENFHVGGLFADGEIRLVYTHYDRMIVGGAVPAGGSLVLDKVAEAGTPSILDRREMGILNIGGDGTVSAAGQDFAIKKGEILYLPMGAGAVTFSGDGRFYITSSPAHRATEAKLVTADMANRLELGAQETINSRTLMQFIHPDVVDSCQLVMGYTVVHEGSAWNTMPAHTHDRRMEAYLYFDIAEGQKVFHFMGQPQQTRHIVMGEQEAVISPPWSIHCGAGTGQYTFCWVMAGDNVDFTDMDMIAMDDLR